MVVNKNHNRVIGFWKFAFCILIILLHTGSYNHNGKYLFEAGSIGVEFFFIVSGYLFCKKCLKYKEVKDKDIASENVKQITKMIRKFFPYFLLQWILATPYLVFYEHFTLSQFIYCLFRTIFFPFKIPHVATYFGIGWYISTLIVIFFTYLYNLRI